MKKKRKRILKKRKKSYSITITKRENPGLGSSVFLES